MGAVANTDKRNIGLRIYKDDTKNITNNNNSNKKKKNLYGRREETNQPPPPPFPGGLSNLVTDRFDKWQNLFYDSINAKEETKCH
jgi:hypothetical protein